MRKLAAALLAMLAAATTLVATTSTAQASTFVGIQTFRALGRTVCIADTTEGLFAVTCNSGQANQRWAVYALYDQRAFANQGFEHECIDDSELGLRAFTCHGSDFQRFTIKHYSDGSIRMRNVETGNCITYSTTLNLYASACNDTASQRFV